MKRILIRLIRFYKRFISPLLPPACRFYPSCSIYAMTAISRYGAAKGSLLAAWRICRCNPFCRGGLDFVPPKVEGEPFREVLGKIRRHETFAEDALTDVSGELYFPDPEPGGEPSGGAEQEHEGEK